MAKLKESARRESAITRPVIASSAPTTGVSTDGQPSANRPIASQFSIAVRSFLLLTLLTGVVYPLVVTGLAGVLFPKAAGGSLIAGSAGSAPVASGLVGQNFEAPGEFWGRLSQTAESPYNAASSGGSNLGSSNPALTANAQARLDALGLANTKVPVDLLTSSASGLDPEISPLAARVQIPRIAAARGVDPNALEELVSRLTQRPTFGILGQSRVNVVLLNLQLKQLK